MTKDPVREFLSKVGKKGGKAKAKKYTREEIAEQGRRNQPRATSPEKIEELRHRYFDKNEKVPVIAVALGLSEAVCWKHLRALRAKASGKGGKA